MRTKIKASVLLFFWAIISVVAINGQQPSEASYQKPEATRHASCPMMRAGAAAQSSRRHDHHAGHSEDVNSRGDKAMGFSHTKTTHHFRLFRDGGAIEVEANDPKDAASRDRIRQHLAHIAQAFANGDFAIPEEVHNQVPPGAAAMNRLKEAVKYSFEETERGGRVRISTANAEALSGIHEFLRFQIKDHRTGDPLEVSKK
ncbi:MAG TPA: hypothetical protein VJQ56_07960 [Blastocatellia bacterium]|nr:hypothetical protein [Blastocatellia bacterium]